MVIRRGTGSFKCHFQIFEILENFSSWLGAILWWGHAPQFLCYQLDFLIDFFTEEGSYQGLKDATLIGLLSDKSAEIQGLKYSNFGQFSILANSAIFGLRGHGLSSEWCHMHVQRLCFWKKCHVGKAVWRLFQIIKYFDPNISALLAD